jgi:hypothetical protein
LPYRVVNLSYTAAAFCARSSLLKLTDKNTADATKLANVNAANAEVTPAAVPESDAVTHMANRMKIQILPKLSISLSFSVSEKQVVLKKGEMDIRSRIKRRKITRRTNLL